MGERATKPAAYRATRPGMPGALILDLIRSIRHGDRAIKGEAALGLAYLLRWAALDSLGQWGRAYYRCPECDGGHDCEGDEDVIVLPTCRECGYEFETSDLRLSEGWVDRDVCGIEFGADYPRSEAPRATE